MAILTLAEVRDHVQTDLKDDALQRLLDDAEAEIVARLGSPTALSDVLPGGDKMLYLSRKAASISSIVERLEEQDYALVATDFKLHADGRRLERLQTGSNPSEAWRGLVTISGVPDTADAASRKRLQADLVRLSVRYSGVASEGVGDVRVQNLPDYQAERDRLFLALGTRGRRILV